MRPIAKASSTEKGHRELGHWSVSFTGLSSLREPLSPLFPWGWSVTFLSSLR